MKKFFLINILAFISTFTFAAQPTGEDAKAMVRDQANAIAKKLNNNFDLYKNDPQAFNRLISSEVLPYMDFEFMAKYVLGQTWNQATPQQQQAFVNAFRDALISKYSQGWSEYIEPPIKESDLKILGTPKIDKYKRTDVYVQATGKGGKQARVAFSLRFQNGQWKMYDVLFENISILSSYRNSFNGKNIDDLIKELERSRLN